uniref:Uncharacterized protein MANES_09G159400 n=1 Tax=Rhizophora mucronata TaxID=61149 RepID=A0A2P2KMH1_RHIMU
MPLSLRGLVICKPQLCFPVFILFLKVPHNATLLVSHSTAHSHTMLFLNMVQEQQGITKHRKQLGKAILVLYINKAHWQTSDEGQCCVSDNSDVTSPFNLSTVPIFDESTVPWLLSAYSNSSSLSCWVGCGNKDTFE